MSTKPSVFPDPTEAQSTGSNQPDAYWMPYTAQRAFKARPRMIAHADGLYLKSADGRDILDATSGLYCVNAGHGRAEIRDAIIDAASTLDYAPPFQYGHENAFKLAGRLATLAPGDLNHVLFATSGSEAVETALKVALSYHKLRGAASRTRLIGRVRGYHGVGFGGTAVGGMVANRKMFGALVSGVDHLPTTYDHTHQAFSVGEPAWGAHLADALEDLVALHDASTIAAVIVEPVAGSTGCLPPPQGYLERLRAITKAHGILLIFDEVITAFGRLGHMFAAERYGVAPDLICFAKGVTNGAVPLSGVLVTSDVYDAHMTGPEHLPELYHGYTYSGHPLGVAAGLATLDVLERDNLAGRAARNEAAFADAMMSLRDHPNVIDIRPVGLMCGIDLKSSVDGAGVRGAHLNETCFHDHDLYVRIARDTAIIAPPLTAGPADFAMITERLGRGLESVSTT